MSDTEPNAAELLKSLLIAQLEQRDAKKAAALLSEDVIWLGAIDSRSVRGREQAYACLKAEIRREPEKFTLAFSDETIVPVAEGCAAVSLHADVCRGERKNRCLVSAATKQENGAQRICSVHISLPQPEETSGRPTAFSLSRSFADDAYRDFVESSISIGIVGGYDDEPGFPLYTVNQQFLDMLGYANEAEYVRAVGGMIDNCIHPDDMDETLRKTRAQLRKNGSYCVKYRMRRKDGEYITVEDRGKRVRAADGRAVVICLCTDITENEQNVERLRRQADQLSLYRVSQNAAAYRILMDENYTLLYGNDRFYQMIGYKKERFFKELGGSCLAYVIPEDQAMVRAAVRTAQRRKDDYTELVMRIRTGDGALRYIHVVGAFRKTGDGLVLEGIDIDVTRQKLTEKELFESNAVYRILLENSNLSLWTYSIETRTATLISSKKHQRPMSASGTPNYPESVIRTGFIKESSIKDLCDLMARVNSGEPRAEGDVWYNPRNEEAWCDHITYINIFDEAGCIAQTIGIAEDVTERRVAQQRYDEELLYLQTLQNDNLLTKARCNLTQNILESYEAAENVGVAEESMSYVDSIAALAESCYTQEEGARIKTMLSKERICGEFERGQHYFSFDYRRKTREGRVLWVNISVKTYRDMQSDDIKSFMYTTNIDREKTNEDIIRTVAAAEHDYIMLVNLNTGEYALYSGIDSGVPLPPSKGDDYVEMMQTFNRANAVPEDVERIVHDMSPDVIRENLEKNRYFSAAYAGKTPTDAIEYKKIQYFWLDETSGQLVVTRSDVTELTREQQRQQELLRNTLKQAEQASNAKTDFLSKMSHEIRTPMNAIIGMNALAAQNVRDPAMVGDCIAKVGISARYLLSLINDILNMSRIESGKMDLRAEAIPFEEFINGVNAIIYEQASQSGLTYDSIITGCVAETYVGDAMKLQQILLNLLGNAVKFTPAGGKVQLIVSQERMENGVAHMKFTVNDTGVGIGEAFQKVMFDPFEQEHSGTTTPYGGTGLGLAITKNLVELMGGGISVNSIVGVGSEFVVHVPLKVDTSEKAAAKNLAGLHLEKLHALVVDDEILICEQTKSLLLEIGLRAEWVTGGMQAVELVRKKWAAGKKYDIILIDWKMPDMDGIETARRIRGIVGPDITIIIITAYEWTEIEKEAKEAGVNLLITKPLFKSTLISSFERILSPQMPPEAAAVNYDFSGRRVLLVEDHLLNVEVAKRLLQVKGFEVEVAENGLAAIEMFTSNPDGYYDAILMDIRMPVMDGLTAARSIRHLKKATARDIPIIAMSANAFEEDVEKSKAAGMNMHLSKPIEPQRLYAALHFYLK
ncbi:MAG: response regulator [Oscillospiraceae bacterium]|nr:response regulator [Oscillospiraceae bacterium]